MAGGGRRLWSAVPTLSAAPTCEDDQSSVVAAPAARVPPPHRSGRGGRSKQKSGAVPSKEGRHGPTSRSCRGGDAGRPRPVAEDKGGPQPRRRPGERPQLGPRPRNHPQGAAAPSCPLQRRGQNDARWDSQRPRITHWRFPEVERVPTGLKMPHQCRRQQCRFNFGLDVRCLARRRVGVGCVERKSETHSNHHAPRRSRMVRKEVESL